LEAVPRTAESPTRRGTPPLFFDIACFFIETVRAVPATTFAAIAAFEVEFFGETFVAFGGKVKIFAFDWYIFFILVEHGYKFRNFSGMILIVSKYLVPKGFRGMTLFPFVFASDRNASRDLVFINHERIHLRQQLELLVLPFFVIYVLDYLVKLIRYRDWNLAYRNVVFEREAYENEYDLDYLKSRSFWDFVNFL